jgi:hypothetical protein
VHDDDVGVSDEVFESRDKGLLVAGKGLRGTMDADVAER